MTFVALIGLNGVSMSKKCGALAQQRFRTLPARTKASIGVSVMLSLFLWVATALVGLFVMHDDFKIL